MKCQWVFSLLILMLMPGLSVAATDNSPNVPSNVELIATETTVKVDWNGDSNADGYYVYWDTASGSLNNKETVTGQSTTIYTIPDLIPGTKYYVSVSAYNNREESGRSTEQSISTTKDIAKPTTPDGLGVTSVDSIDENSVILKWNKNIESDLDHYTIYYGTTSGSTAKNLEAQNDDASSFTVSGLLASTRYYFSISATDVADNESDKSQSLIVDTLVDTLPPDSPATIFGTLSNINEITITIDNSNIQMADFSGNILFYGTTSGNLDHEVNLGKAFTYTVPNLEENSTLYFSALSYDIHDNKSALTDEASTVVEETQRYLNQPEAFDGGCFIRSAAAGSDARVAGGFSLIFLIPIIGWLFYRLKNFSIMLISCLLTLSFASNSNAETSEALGANIAGIFAGYYLPSESKYEDFYDNDILLLSAFYERQLSELLSMDVESGFMKEDGQLLTVSGNETEIGTDLTLVPVAVSLNVYKEFMHCLVGYAGAGPDYWYCREETDASDAFPKIEEWVGGCHAKAGVKLYNTDIRFKNTGAIIETSYSWIARFGSNDTDLGGWAFKFGLFYQF